MIKFFFLFMLLLLIFNGCSSSTESNLNKDLFKYKNSYVGDNGAVGNITRQLPSPEGEGINGLELKTEEKPYGIIVNYKNIQTNETTEKNYEKTALYNATFIFALVKNVDWVQFNFVEKEYKVTREELQKWYGKDLREFENEDELSKFTKRNLTDKNKVKLFFN
ncbi:DUF4825 domain-containing protein [Neobacillus sp. LXY-1]|uniref:DUF4825 domain-containing protein n=1 Tax=Neobacillus sp. LXY-1 TaxID=3379133 RepID=UPI003EE177F6